MVSRPGQDRGRRRTPVRPDRPRLNPRAFAGRVGHLTGRLTPHLPSSAGPPPRDPLELVGTAAGPAQKPLPPGEGGAPPPQPPRRKGEGGGGGKQSAPMAPHSRPPYP